MITAEQRTDRQERISKLKLRLMDENLSEESIRTINQTIRELEEGL